MLTRRGFLAAVSAIVAAPRALFAREHPITLGLSGDGTYQWKVTFVTASGETPAGDVREFTRRSGDVIARRLYTSDGSPGGSFKFVGNVPPNASGWRTGPSGSYFIDADGRRI